MRLAFVTTEYPGLTGQDGGLARHVQRMARALLGAGHECLVFLASPELDPGLPERTHDNRVPIVIVKPPGEISASSPLRDMDIPKEFAWVEQGIRVAWAAGETIAKHHAEHRFDAVQVTNLMFLGLFQQADVPLLLRFSSYQPMLRQASGGFLTPATLALEYLEREAAYGADTCFAPSRFLASKVERELCLPVRVIRPPVYLECPESQWDWSWWKREIEPLGPYLAFAGSLARLKGCHIIARAFPSVLQQGLLLRLHLAGRDLGELASLKSASPNHVHHHGSLPHERLYPLLARSLAVLAPSLVENLSNSVIEGMLLGKTVISTLGTSGEELLSDGRGILVRPNDVDDLVAAMVKVINPATERSAIGERARRFAEDELGPKPAVTQWLAMVEGLRHKGPVPRTPAAHQLRKVLPNLRALAELDCRCAELDCRCAELESRAAQWRERYARVARQFPVQQLLAVRRRILGHTDPLDLPDE